MNKRDREYYLARVSAEREAAKLAADEHVRRVHLQLADRYDELLQAGRLHEPSARS